MPLRLVGEGAVPGNGILSIPKKIDMNLLTDFYRELESIQVVTQINSSRCHTVSPKDNYFMEWNQSNAIGLAKSSCTCCQGLGLRPVWKTEAPCGCVLRAIFRACYNRFRECADKSITSVSLEFYQGGYSNRAYSRKKEEYAADFCLIARRSLEEEEYNLFRFYYLLRADHRMCQKRLNMDRHQVPSSPSKCPGKAGTRLRRTAALRHLSAGRIFPPGQPCFDDAGPAGWDAAAEPSTCGALLAVYLR